MGNSTSIADLIAAPSSEKVVLAEIELGQSASGWALTAGQTNTYEIALAVTDTITLADDSTETLTVVASRVEEDGAELTQYGSVANVEANAGSWWHDTAAGKLYVHAGQGGDPSGSSVIYYFWLYLATKTIILASPTQAERIFEPYIADRGVPGISLRNDQIFWGVVDLSAGELVLANGRGYFDQLSMKYLWINKNILIRVGGDNVPGQAYATIYKGRIAGTSFGQEYFRVKIQSRTHDLLRTLPLNSFWTSDYPGLDPAAVGKPIPLYWGKYNRTQAPVVTCIGTDGQGGYDFKICDCTIHPIAAIQEVYVDIGAGGGWSSHALENPDTHAGTFTITDSSFILGVSRVKVQFEGYCPSTANPTVIEGAPEIVEDILVNFCDYSSADINQTVLAASKTISARQLNVPVETEQSALTIIEGICKSDLAWFDEDAAGLVRYRTYDGTVSNAGALLIDKNEMLSLPEIYQNTDHLFYKVRVGYSYNCSEGEYVYSSTTTEDVWYQFRKKDVLLHQTYLRNAADAAFLASELAQVTRTPPIFLTVDLKMSQLARDVGDAVYVNLDRAPNSSGGGWSGKTFQILSKDISFFPQRLRMTAQEVVTFAAWPTPPEETAGAILTEDGEEITSESGETIIQE